VLTAGEVASMRDCVASALPDTGAALWSGECRVNPKPGVTREVQIGDAHAITSWYIATLPYDATGFEVDDYFTTTASALSVDLIGLPMRIVEIERMSWELGRRLTLHIESAGETPS
jgi:hypothetical protein